SPRRWERRRPSLPILRSARFSFSRSSLFFLLPGLGRLVAGDDRPEVDALDGVGDDLACVFGAGVGAVELVAGQGDPLVGEMFVDGLPVLLDDRVDVVVAGYVAERGSDVVAQAGDGPGIGDHGVDGSVAGSGLLLSVLAVDLSDSACGETEFCGCAGLCSPLPLGGVPLDGFADDAAASGRQLAVDVRLDAF